MRALLGDSCVVNHQHSIAATHKLAERLAGDVPHDVAEVARLILADAGIYGAPWVLEMWMADGKGDVTSAPHFTLLAPFIKNRCPELWSKYRQPLLVRAGHFKTERENGFLAAFDAAGEAPEPSDMEFRAVIGKATAVKPRVNGVAAVPLPEQIEQTEGTDATAYVSPLPAAVNPRVFLLVRQFHRAVERQRVRHEEWIATFERVTRDPRVRQIIKQICETEKRT